MRSLPVVLVLHAGLAVPTPAQQAPTAESLQVQRATSEIKIDGQLDEPAWASAALLEAS